jgi:hypothetical protein
VRERDDDGGPQLWSTDDVEPDADAEMDWV